MIFASKEAEKNVELSLIRLVKSIGQTAKRPRAVAREGRQEAEGSNPRKCAVCFRRLCVALRALTIYQARNCGAARMGEPDPRSSEARDFIEPSGALQTGVGRRGGTSNSGLQALRRQVASCFRLAA